MLELKARKHVELHRFERRAFSLMFDGSIIFVIFIQSYFIWVISDIDVKVLAFFHLNVKRVQYLEWFLLSQRKRIHF